MTPNARRLLRGYGPLLAFVVVFLLMAVAVPTVGKEVVAQNASGTKGQAETRGPFVDEHAAVRAEGCLGCHSPHGSQNARMLNMPSINTLCNQCHSPVAAGTVHGMGAGSASYQPCTSCHTYIHGSNINQAFLR